MSGFEGSFVCARLALGLLVLAGAALLGGCGSDAGAQSGPPPAAPVSVAPAVQRTVMDSEEFSGRLEATEFVELRPRVAGTIEKVHFSDGTLVARGQLLYTIDPRPFQAEVARAEALVTAARSRAALAASEVARAQGLLDAKAVSRQEYDQLASSQRTTESDIRAAEAALQVARLNLGHASVRAPIAGRISRANVTAGNLVSEQTVLTTIAGSGQVYAYFDGSEQTYLRLRSTGEKTPKVRMGLANEQGFPHEGRVDFVDNRLNPQTGAIRLRARFANERGEFTPGLAARMVLTTSAPYSAVMVPERAIGTDQTKKMLFVVGADGMPQPREVKLGALFGGMRVVQGGVKAGEHVVVDGLQRIIPGMPVAPQVLAVDASGMPVVPPPAPPGAPPKAEGGAPAAKKSGTT
ncbi:MAG TPA: efflux RND transporter periplasmic adaptor subunit [Caldimonas sp.]|jgi:multidrug efflux system membrane fusion protein|nr:efflux RND transporter periplasmic adaptor subunit [Caldimonas sp.]HEX2541652.1 efflux RND transporter periplasmic adaptor subunit [Caldimonas sp.]